VREDCPHVRRGERFAQKLANGGGGEVAPSQLGATAGSATTASRAARLSAPGEN
jgi:hypothetical protein